MAQCKCRLLSINVYHQTEPDGDEIFLRQGRRRIWPPRERFQKLGTMDSAVRVDYTLDDCQFGDLLEFQLFEYDNPILNRRLGTFKLSLSSLGGPYTTDIERNTKYFSSYALVWEVIKK